MEDDRSDPPPGTLSFDTGFFRAIAERVLARIEGIRAAGHGRGGLIQRIRDRLSEHIHVAAGPQEITYDLGVVVRAEGDMRSICRQVQRELAADARTMTGYERVTVNVSVRGIE